MGGRLSRAIAPLLLFLFLFGIAGAQSICTNTVPASITINQIPLIGIALIALSISFDVIAIGYIVGKLVPGTQLSNWVKKEYWEVAKSAMLIAGIYSVLVLLGSLAVSLAGSSVSVPAGGSLSTSLSALTTASQSYLSNVFCGTASVGGAPAGGANYMSYIIGLSFGLGALSNLQVGYYIPIPLGLTILQVVPTFTLGTSFTPYKNPMLSGAVDAGGYESMVNDALSMVILPVYTVVGMEYYLMPMLVYVGLAFMIPMGIIFRSMPFVRGIGGTLIGIGIGITIVFPSILLIINQPITSIVNTYMVSNLAQSNSPSAWWLSAMKTYFPSGAGMGDALASINTIYPGLNGIFNYTLEPVVQFLLLLLDLAIAFPLIDSIAKSLGGTINIEFGKLKIK